MNNIHSKYKDKEGNTLTISYDLNPESPREWDGQLGQFLFPSDSRYLHWEKDCLRYNLDDLRDIHREHFDYFLSDKDLIYEYLGYEYVWYSPLYKYEHSGIVLSLSPFSCTFDSGQIGWYVVTKEKAIENEIYPIFKIGNHGLEQYTDPENLDVNLCKTLCEQEIKIFNHYLSGEVYEYKYNDGKDSEEYVGGYYDLDDILHQFEGMEIVNE